MKKKRLIENFKNQKIDFKNKVIAGEGDVDINSQRTSVLYTYDDPWGGISSSHALLDLIGGGVFTIDDDGSGGGTASWK